MKNISTILIDPLNGFCSSDGTLARAYGIEELKRINDTIPNIERALGNSQRRHLVKSEYDYGQFTHGKEDSAMANLCVPGANKDTEVIPELKHIDFDSCIVKRQKSAFSNTDFRHYIEKDIEIGVASFVLAGFLIEHCVMSTALDLQHFLSPYSVNVIICVDLVASRLEKYHDGTIASTEKILQDKGCKLQLWNEIIA